MLYALLMAAVFSLLLQFYLNRQVAHQRNMLAQAEGQTAYAMALLTQENLQEENGDIVFQQGTSSYRRKEGRLHIQVALKERSYHFSFPEKEKKASSEQGEKKDDGKKD